MPPEWRSQAVAEKRRRGRRGFKKTHRWVQAISNSRYMLYMFQTHISNSTNIVKLWIGSMIHNPQIFIFTEVGGWMYFLIFLMLPMGPVGFGRTGGIARKKCMSQLMVPHLSVDSSHLSVDG